MQSVEEAVVFAEIENALRETPSSETWKEVTQLPTTDRRSSFWRRYKERLSGIDAEQFTSSTTVDSHLNHVDVGWESLIWRDLTAEMLEVFNKLFPHIKATDLNDKNCDDVSMKEIISSYVNLFGSDTLTRRSVLIDVICDPLATEFSKRIGDVGICCGSETLRAKSKTTPLNYICGKRSDLVGITDWVMRRYGGTRRESSLFLSLMWWGTYLLCLSGGNFDAKHLIDTTIGVVDGSIIEQVTSTDGDRMSYPIGKTELASSAIASAAKSLTTAVRIYAAFETVITARRGYKKEYEKLYQEVSKTDDATTITPNEYLKSRYADGMLLTFISMVLVSDYGEAFDPMTGSVYLASLEAGAHYNDLSDAVMDLKHSEPHNYIICAKINSNYSYSGHAEALYVSLTTFDEPHNSFDVRVKRRLVRYRCASIVYFSTWARYRASERARRYVGSLSVEERTKLVERGRRCVLGDEHVEENIWLDRICSNFSKRRLEIRNRGYAGTLLYVLGVEDDQAVHEHICSAVKAIGMRPFDTGMEMVMSLGSVWLAKLALRFVVKSTSYDSLLAELSDLLGTLSLHALPIISENTITPCESLCGPICLRLCEMFQIVSEIDRNAGDAIISVVAAVIGMVSLDPFRCIAYHADELVASK